MNESTFPVIHVSETFHSDPVYTSLGSDLSIREEKSVGRSSPTLAILLDLLSPASLFLIYVYSSARSWTQLSTYRLLHEQ
jgi:hypothetical protein